MKKDNNKNNSKLLFKSSNGMIEICEMPEDKMGGRVKIKMSAHEIYPSRSTANENGICWLEQYVQNNIETCIGMPYVVSWLGTKEDGIPSDHGRMEYCDDGSIIFEGDVVGSVQDAYIENIEIDGVVKKVLMTEGYIYEQRNKAFVQFLKEQQKDGDVVYGSVEINGKDGNTDIEYLDGRCNPDGSLKMDRVPVNYSYSGLAILFDTPPADTSSQVIEVNNKIDPINNEEDKKNEVKELKSTEINKNVPNKSDLEANKNTKEKDTKIIETNKDKNDDSKEVVEESVAKDLVESKPKLKVDESKDKISDTPWGDVDKSKDKKDVIMAKNFEEIAPKIFMKLGSRWKEGIEGELGYPVMQKIDDTFVYNKGGLSSALGYAKTENETDIVNKIEKIRKDLGLDEEVDNKKETNSIEESEKESIQKSKIIINKKQEGEISNMNLVKKGQKIEVNNLDTYDFEQLLQKAFLISIGCVVSGKDSGYYIDKLYPLNSEFIVTKWDRNGEDQYYKSSYNIDTEGKTVTLGDIYEVKQTWTPVNNEQPIEMNAKKKKVEKTSTTKSDEGGETNMDANKKLEECNVKIGELNAKAKEKDAKITELNEAVVNANKELEEVNAKLKKMQDETNKCKTETNSYKEKYDALVAEKAVAETNSYFETEIKKNGFEEVETNSLKDFVSKGDLEGLKKAEAELCAKKFKELRNKSDEVKIETNSVQTSNIIPTKEEKIPSDIVEEGKSLFM